VRRCDLEHIIRAAGAISGDHQIVVIGSQSILGQFPEAPAMLLRSAEADVFPANRLDASDLIDGAIGEGSHFHELFGYYAQGTTPNAASLPDGWMNRVVTILNSNTNGITGLCLEVHDLAVSKYVAGRPKDLEFTALLARFRMTFRKRLLELAPLARLDDRLLALVTARIERDFRGGS
jgi:hypothetical protein